ncbi:unnamed protein product [Miscanthus lutarioriparius]|uniref:Uncharacterized protein n=1 Tax=Miscanthus lutarioriparius TaxID=422564 RepID=A0A811RBL1_9POAL|nr:unnamed protein product [Miscanthus lutarioriparius]
MNPCPASAKCVNTEGGHKCSCPRGRRPKADGSGGCEIDYSMPAIVVLHLSETICIFPHYRWQRWCGCASYGVVLRLRGPREEAARRHQEEILPAAWRSPPLRGDEAITAGAGLFANILLDENYNAKVSDFGASVLAPSDEAHLVTLVQGTCGKALALAAPEEERSLAAHFLSSVKDGRLDALLDAGIRGEVGGEVLGIVAKLAKRCLEMSGEKRPPMREVAEEVDRVRKLWRQRCFGEVAVLVSDDR